ncbi:MAG TPA: MMPL family transporter [Alphaproteobacteria bacterium]|nr:MMPL family transporter [Alphaproteobacteria bacterium]
MKPRLIARIVNACCRWAWVVALAGMALGALSAVYTVRHFAITTDSINLISPDLPWRRDKAAFDEAFPRQSAAIVVVVDGTTPELAEWGTARLAARLAARSDSFKSVERPDGSQFFARNGLLLLPLADVATAMDQLIASQGFLGPLAADPSLRGVMGTLDLALEGVRQGETTLDKLARPLAELADALGRVAQGEPAFFSWQTLISGGPAGTRETRRFILVQPKLDYGALAPAARASHAVRAAARALDLSPQNGVRVRLTGEVQMEDEEFSTLTQHLWLMTFGTLGAVLVMLWLAVRSLRIIACIVITTVVGLLATAGLGLLAVGRFNVISVAFVPLFVGLGIDFGIQFSVRYRAERLVHRDLRDALTAAGSTVGGSLALAAGAIAVGFCAFLPTSYVGASELGVIAGAGMVIAFLLSITLLPALLTLARPGAETAEIGFAALAPLDRYLMSRRRRVLASGGVAAILCLILLPLVRFDFNPLHLRSLRVESTSTLMDLLSEPDETPNTIDVLAPSLAAADALAKRLAALPEVDHALSLSSFIPSDQAAKLALVKDASNLLDLTLNPLAVKPAPSDGETAQSLARTAGELRRTVGAATTAAAAAARRLAAVLDTLATGTPALRARASETLIRPLLVMLDQLRAALQAEAVTLRSLPPELVRDWIAADGRARIEVYPKGDSNDNRTLERFTAAVRTLAPAATGAPITILEAGRTVVSAFVQAGFWSLVAITILLAAVLRRIRDVAMTVIPILLMGLLTMASSVLIGPPLNFADIIALPLLFGIGVAFNIYFVVAWRSGATNLLQSSLTRAVLFSALTTATAFGSLWLSPHPGTASMGKLLVISLAWTLVTALLFEPALLGPPPRSQGTAAPRDPRELPAASRRP